MDTVDTWRGRFAAGGLPALADCKRSGRPVSFTALQVAEVKALVCQLPAGPARRCRAGRVRSRPGRWSPSPSSGRSPVPPCGADSNKTRSSPGSSSPVSPCATPSSGPRPHAGWIRTPAPSTAPRWARTSMRSLRMRRLPSRRVAAATRHWHPGSPGRCALTTNTTAAARWPAWPRTTSIAPVSLASANPERASGPL